MKNIIVKTTITTLKKMNFIGEKSSLTVSQKSDIVRNLLAQFPTQNIIIEEIGDKYEILSDGGFIGAVKEFITDKFTLDCNEELDKFLHSNNNGLTFSNLDENVKDSLMESEIGIFVCRNLEQLERAFLKSKFAIGVNPELKIKIQAVPIEDNVIIETSPMLTFLINKSSKEKTLESYTKIDFFKKTNITTPTADVILAMMIVKDEHGVTIDLSAKNMEEYKNTTQELPDITEEFTYMDLAFQDKTSYLKKLHLPMIKVCARKAINLGMDANCFQKIINSFFTTESVEYKKASDSGTATKSNVNKRLNIITAFFDVKYQELGGFKNA